MFSVRKPKLDWKLSEVIDYNQRKYEIEIVEAGATCHVAGWLQVGLQLLSWQKKKSNWLWWHDKTNMIASANPRKPSPSSKRTSMWTLPLQRTTRWADCDFSADLSTMINRSICPKNITEKSQHMIIALMISPILKYSKWHLFPSSSPFGLPTWGFCPGAGARKCGGGRKHTPRHKGTCIFFWMHLAGVRLGLKLYNMNSQLQMFEYNVCPKSTTESCPRRKRLWPKWRLVSQTNPSWWHHTSQNCWLMLVATPFRSQSCLAAVANVLGLFCGGRIKGRMGAEFLKVLDKWHVWDIIIVKHSKQRESRKLPQVWMFFCCFLLSSLYLPTSLLFWFCCSVALRPIPPLGTPEVLMESQSKLLWLHPP